MTTLLKHEQLYVTLTHAHTWYRVTGLKNGVCWSSKCLELVFEGMQKHWKPEEFREVLPGWGRGGVWDHELLGWSELDPSRACWSVERARRAVKVWPVRKGRGGRTSSPAVHMQAVLGLIHSETGSQWCCCRRGVQFRWCGAPSIRRTAEFWSSYVG